MNIIGGETISVYRNTKDRFGDKSSETLVGTIDNPVFQPAGATTAPFSYAPNEGFQETATLNAMFWLPRHAPIKAQARDRIVFGANTYQVISERQWDTTNPVTGTDFGYYAVEVETVV